MLAKEEEKEKVFLRKFFGKGQAGEQNT